MDSRVKILGHSIHQQLIVFPLGLLGTAAIFDLLYLLLGNETMALVAFWMMVAGIAGGVCAAPFGWIDWFAIPGGTRAKTIGLMHGATNVVVLVLFIISALLRWDSPQQPAFLAHAAVLVGFVLALFGGWLGGVLVSRLGVGVYEGAHLNASNSLSGQPAQKHDPPPLGK